eukprot:CAMPEP_0116061422 /NCGR_PEP_ID=MMETSP0322-20121206/7080_1 /TAXON_ID=163516 /ORGANISM="Leptocylindrus danicus var. apora, Strain B651" /LENGTH=592 /DNA_ID=CAMNT_0003546387 /DNA_START=146 /DNA_END=1924 /DNA_ORIENTATION=-
MTNLSLASVHTREVCMNVEGYLTAEGESCATYEANPEFCEEYGSCCDVNGYVPNTACCVCGGGQHYFESCVDDPAWVSCDGQSLTCEDYYATYDDDIYLDDDRGADDYDNRCWRHDDDEAPCENGSPHDKCCFCGGGILTLTPNPTKSPTKNPTPSPTQSPTDHPVPSPSSHPTVSPSTSHPTASPSSHPTASPSSHPTASPSTSHQPTASPSISHNPTAKPSSHPTASPSSHPTVSPSSHPTASPSAHPSISHYPTTGPSVHPTESPSSHPTAYPSKSNYPTTDPLAHPIASPSTHPTKTETPAVTTQPAEIPIGMPSNSPTTSPTQSATIDPNLMQFASVDVQLSGLSCDEDVTDEVNNVIEAAITVALEPELMIIDVDISDHNLISDDCVATTVRGYNVRGYSFQAEVVYVDPSNLSIERKLQSSDSSLVIALLNSNIVELIEYLIGSGLAIFTSGELSLEVFQAESLSPSALPSKIIQATMNPTKSPSGSPQASTGQTLSGYPTVTPTQTPMESLTTTPITTPSENPTKNPIQTSAKYPTTSPSKPVPIEATITDKPISENSSSTIPSKVLYICMILGKLTTALIILT